MESFGQDMYTTKVDELPENMTNFLKTNLSLDVTTDNFVSATWIMNFFSKSKIFCIVLNDRVVYNFTSIEQNYYSSVTGIEKNLYNQIIMTSAGNRTIIFSQGFGYTPKKDVIEKIFADINRAFNDYNTQKNEEETSVKEESPDILIKKLYALYQQGILTEEEFTLKKKKILDDI